MRGCPLSLLLLLPSLASAHIGARGAADVSLPADRPGSVVLQEPWGLVLSDDGDTYGWVCHELLGAPGVAMFPSFATARDGAMLAITGMVNGTKTADEGLFRSVDGCDWEAVTGLTGRLVVDATFDPADAERALAVTGDFSLEGFENIIALSTDGGETFAPVHTDQDVLFRGVRFAADGSAWAVGVTEGPLTAWLYRSADGQAPWTRRTLDPGTDEVGFPRLLGTDPTDPDALWLLFDNNNSDVLVRTEDGGETLQEVVGGPTVYVDLLASSDGTTHLTGGDRELFSVSPELQLEARSAPPVWGGAADDDGLWLATDVTRERTALVRGPEQSPVLDVFDIGGPLECAPDSDVAVACAPLWQALIDELEATVPDEEDDDDSAGDDDDSGDDDGCSCSTGAERRAPPGLIMLLPVALYVLRRRESP